MLESVCMRDEPLPQTMAERASQMVSLSSAPAPGMAPPMVIGGRNTMSMAGHQPVVGHDVGASALNAVHENGT